MQKIGKYYPTVGVGMKAGGKVVVVDRWVGR